jgi:hypothetical protein
MMMNKKEEWSETETPGTSNKFNVACLLKEKLWN